MTASIPEKLHFVWIGERLPWFARLAVESALKACPRARATLWATHDLSSDACTQALSRHPRFGVAHLNERDLFADASDELPCELLARLFAGLSQPAARANLARLLILYREGGVYLDTDTVTLRDLADLAHYQAYCGLEHVIWPLEKRYGFHPYRVLGGPLRGLVRNACARLPRGERVFRRLSPLYFTAANNAVLGFTARHPFVRHMLQRVAALPEADLPLRYRLGTHLLQECLAEAGDALGVRQLPPSVFYPLGPEISRQYFRERANARESADLVLQADTHVVHWYASVSELANFDEARVRAERERTLFAQIAWRVLD
ncbi:MAG: glycosyltransferase [Myxococcales bacterium]